MEHTNNNKRRKIEKHNTLEMSFSAMIENRAKRQLEALIPLLQSVIGCSLYGMNTTHPGVRRVLHLFKVYPGLHQYKYDYIDCEEGYMVNRPDCKHIIGVSGESLLHAVAKCLDVQYEPYSCISTGARMNRTADNIFQKLWEYYQTTNHYCSSG